MRGREEKGDSEQWEKTVAKDVCTSGR